MVSSVQGKKNKSDLLKRFSVFLLVLLLFLIPFIEFNNSTFPNKNEKNEFDTINPDNEIKLANGDSILFQGTENALNITDYGNLYELNQEVSLDNEEELNLTYNLDDGNNWKVSKIETSINNIHDSRNWVNDNDFQNITVFRKDVDIATAHPYSATPQDTWKDPETIDRPGAIAMRVHFDYIDFDPFDDFVRILNNNSESRYLDTGSKSNFFSPWIKSDELIIEIYSEDTVNNLYDGYIIDYYEFVNSSSNYFINHDEWGFNEDTLYASEFGPGYADNISAMYLALFSDYTLLSDSFYSKYDKNKFTEIYQNLTVERGNIVDAYISFDYYPEFCMDSYNFLIYVEINKERIQSIFFGDIHTYGTHQWHSTSKFSMNNWDNTTNIFTDNLNNMDLNISIGLKCMSNSYFGNYDDGFQQLIWFDNVTLGLTTIANSTQNGINITINEYELFDGNQWGQSSQVLNGSWDTNPVTLTINTTSPSLTFDLNTTLYGYHNTTAKINQQFDEGVSYNILENGTIYWEFLHNFYWPFEYSDFEFEISKPANWRFLYAKDQGGNFRNFEGGDIGDNILKINKTEAVFYGWWSFKATSPNFLNTTNTELLKKGQWVQSLTSFKSGESTKIKAQVNYSNEIPPNVDSTYVNLTIYDPGGSVWYENATKPLSNGTVVFPKITFDSSNTTGGYYNYTLFWTNGTSLGGIESNFIVNHNSSLTLLKPDDALGDLKTDGFWGDLIPLRVYLKDTERDSAIVDAGISYNWTGGQEIVGDAGSGIYEVAIDTGDLPGPGLYRIVINSSKIGFFDSNLTLEISLNDVTNLQVLDSDYFIEFHGNGTIKLKFSNSTLGGIDGATVELNITESKYYYINNTGNGIYEIEFNSSFLPSMGIYKLHINFTADLYEPQFYIYQFQITEQSVNLTVLINSQEIEENDLIRATFNDIVSISVKAMAINDKDYLSGANITWIGEIYEVNLTESANLWYNESIKCSSSSVSLGINYIYVKFYLNGYATTNFDFQLIISQKTIEVVPIDFDDSVDAEPGEDITIEIRLKETGSNTNIDGAIVSYSWEYGVGTLDHQGNGIYELELEIPEDIEEDDYKVTLVISTGGSVYKATEYSFIVDVEKEEEEGLSLIVWIILAVLLGIISVLGVLSFRSYVYLPRKRRKESELLAKTQRYKDLDNIQAIVIIHRLSGIPVYMKSFGILETQKKELFSGFIQAITSIGAEISTKPAIIVEETEADKIEKLIEIDFKHFYCLIADKESVRLVIILKENASERLKEQTNLLSFAIQLKLRDLFEDWDGELNQFEIDIPPVINEYLELYYKGQFTLTKPYILAKMREEHELNHMETRIVNVIRSFAKSKSEFYLEYVLHLIAEENKDLVIEGIESLIERKAILPAET